MHPDKSKDSRAYFMEGTWAGSKPTLDAENLYIAGAAAIAYKSHKSSHSPWILLLCKKQKWNISSTRQLLPDIYQGVYTQTLAFAPSLKATLASLHIAK